MEAPTVAVESPLAADLGDLFARHHAHCHADTPPGSIHMLPRDALATPDTVFHVLRDGAGRPLAMGAVKAMGGGDAEVKSMHLVAEARGSGAADRLLAAMMARARRDGIARLWLETGAQPSFGAARRLYERHGFAACPPFGDYRPDANSVFMTRTL